MEIRILHHPIKQIPRCEREGCNGYVRQESRPGKRTCSAACEELIDRQAIIDRSRALIGPAGAEGRSVRG